MLAQDWPCWLAPVLALGLNIASAFVTTLFCPFFSPFVSFEDNILWRSRDDWHTMIYWPTKWDNHVLLMSGSVLFLDSLLGGKLSNHIGPILFCLDTVFTGRRVRNVTGAVRKAALGWACFGLSSKTVTHADFGGVMSASHIVGFCHIDVAALCPCNPLLCTLSHVINPALRTFSQKIPPLTSLSDPPPRAVINVAISTTKLSEMVQHPGGLLDITQAWEDVGCRSVFNKSGWVHCPLTASEFLRAYGVPLCMDMLLVDDNHKRNMILCHMVRWTWGR